jgi:hypothetical protein
MLFCVTFHVGMRDAWMLQETGFGCCWRFAGKGISQEEGSNRLAFSSTNVAGRLEQLNLNTQT